MRRIRLTTALKNQSQKSLANDMGLSQSYIHRLTTFPNCWLYLDDENKPARIEYQKTMVIERRQNGII